MADTWFMAKKRTHICKCEPVGTQDIAHHLGLKPNTIHVYNSRGELPEPRWTASGMPLWCWEEDIEPWAATRRFYKPRQVS